MSGGRRGLGTATRLRRVGWCALALLGVASLLGSLTSLAAHARGSAPAGYTWKLPLGFPEPRVPDDNPMTEVKVRLGRYLFYDTRLSGPGNTACATCHQQALAFSDGRARARGATGELHPRSAMSLTNAAYGVRFGWADPTLDSLEQQALVPLLNEHPIEMGAAGHSAEIEQRLAAVPLYPPLFREAFPDDPRPLRLENAVRALACFERTLLSGNSPYDRLLFRDEQTALSPAARRGMRLFFSERLACARCHAGIPLSGPASRSGAPAPEPRFHNTGLYDLGLGRYPADNEGVYRFSGRAEDMGRFRAPTLRNIGVTAPYMHDGSLTSLEEVIDHYAAGGRTTNPLKSELLRGFEISSNEKSDLVAFLHSLTDVSFLADPQLANPFE